RLYAINTLGAVIGSLVGGFVFLPNLGLHLSTLLTAILNILIGLATYLLSRQWNLQSPAMVSDKDPVSESKSPSDEKLSLAVIATMISFAISGALAMIYEVSWTRCLLMVIGSTTYAFTIMLSTFLIGIFLGSFICSRFVDSLKSPIIWFALAEIYVGFGGFLALKCFNLLTYGNLALSYQWGKDPGISMLLRFLSAGAILLPITLSLGAIFPLTVKVCAIDLNRVGTSVGKLYAMNTLGAIAGALLAGFLIIPVFGNEQSLIGTSVANLLLGLSLIILFAPLRKIIKVLSALAMSVVLVWAAQGPRLLDQSSIIFAQSERRRLKTAAETSIPSFDKWREQMGGLGNIIFTKDGLCANVAISVVEPQGGPKITTLFTNGHADASDSLDMKNQAMLAVFPLLFKPQAQDLCVVGWGSGVTAGYALRFPIKSLVCAEIEPVVVETSKYFHSVNFVAEADRRCRIEPSDGRNFLQISDQKFDAIISEPSNPWQAGVCNLFTEEYFRVCRSRLNPGGVFSMWSQINEIPTKNLTEVFAALKKSFPCVFVLESGHADVVAIALPEDGKLSLKNLTDAMASPGIANAISRFGINSADDFIGRIRVCPGGMDLAVKGSSANCDDTNKLEYDVARSYESRLYVSQNYQWLQNNSGEIWEFIDWGDLNSEHKALRMGKIARACLSDSPLMAKRWAEQSLKTKFNADALSLIADIQILQRDFSAALNTLKQGQRSFPDDARFLGLAGLIEFSGGNYQEARLLLSEAAKKKSADGIWNFLLAQTYSNFDSSSSVSIFFPAPDSELSSARVVELCEAAVDKARYLKQAGFLLMLADAYRQEAQYDKSIVLVSELVKSRPNSYLAWRILSEDFRAKNDKEDAELCAKRVNAIVSRLVPDCFAAAKNARQKGNEVIALKNLQEILKAEPDNQEAQQFLKDYAAESKGAARLLKCYKFSANSIQLKSPPR
ncbi:MAG: fused MFS/spermidine synthase, partial [Candidatus Obscuribacterales bacterium]|nr:fused MFS/spermidine synthase [Candidatus Obscuribacterales bacterium]